MNEARPVNPHNEGLDYFECVPMTLDDYNKTPVRFQFTVTLPVTPEVLFKVFEDPESWPKWAMGIGSVIWTSPKPYQVGTTRTVIFWGGMEVYEDFIAWDPGKEMAFTFTGTTQEVWTRFGEHYKVEDHGDGTCTLTWTVAYEPTGFFGRIHPFITPMMKFNLGGYMRSLKKYCAKL